MALNARDLHVGLEHEALVVDNLTRTQMVMYSGTSGDYNPLHSDEIFATEVASYPSVFAHGMLTMGMTGRVVTDFVGDGRLTHYSGRFTSQVWPGDTLTARLTVEAIREDGDLALVELALSTTNQNGEQVLNGRAIARVDP